MEKILISKANKKVVIQIREILFLEAQGKYSQLNLINSESYLSTKCLKEFESLLCNQHFCRIHRKFLINLHFLKEYHFNDKNRVIMANGQCFPVAFRKKQFISVLIQNLPGTI